MFERHIRSDTEEQDELGRCSHQNGVGEEMRGLSRFTCSDAVQTHREDGCWATSKKGNESGAEVTQAKKLTEVSVNEWR